MQNLETINNDILSKEMSKIQLEELLIEYLQEIEETRVTLEIIRIDTESHVYNDPEYKNEKARSSEVKKRLSNTSYYSEQSNIVNGSAFVVKKKELRIKTLRKEIDHLKRLLQIKMIKE